MSKLSESIVGQIKKQAIKPVPRRWFLLKYGLIWLLAGLAVIGGGIFFGSLIAELQHADWRLASRWPGGRIGYLREAVSALWAISTGAAIAGAIIFLRHTRHGYRYGGITLFALLAAGTTALAFAVLSTPVPQHMRDIEMRMLPGHISASEFHNPAAGRLLGEIVSVGRDTAYLRGVDGSDWELWLFGEQTIAEKTFVRVFGEPLQNNVFAVLSIIPVPPRHSVQEFPASVRMQR